MRRAAMILALLLLTAAARADVIRLQDGRLLQGEITSHSAEAITFQRWDNDGVVVIPWEMLLEEDQLKYRKRLGYILETDESHLEIQALQVILTTGATFIGVEVPERSTATELTLRSLGSTVVLDRAQIENAETVQMPILSVLAPEEIYEFLLARIDPQDAEGHYVLGDSLMQAYLYEQAREHLLQARELGGEGYEEFVQGRLQVCEEGIANAALRDRRREIELLIGQNQYHRAEAAVQALAADYEGTGKFEMGTEEERGEGLMLLARIADERDRYLRKTVARVFYRELDRVARDFVTGKLDSWAAEHDAPGRPPKPGIGDAQSFARGRMMEEILTRVARTVGMPHAESVLAADISLDGTEISLARGADFPVPGDRSFPPEALFMVMVDDEWIQYRRVSGNRLLGCSRGVGGSEPRSHDRGALVVFGTDSETAEKLTVDVKPYFEARVPGSHSASYSSGTYIVDMRGREITKGGEGGRSQGRDRGSDRSRFRSSGGSSSGARLLDPEEWWDKQDTSTRKSWLEAFFADNNLEVVGVSYTTCSNCGGRGDITIYDSSGSSSKICTACHGPGAFRVVRYY